MRNNLVTLEYQLCHVFFTNINNMIIKSNYAGLLLLAIFIFATTVVSAQTKPASKQWYESLQLRGYMQVRYNRLLETNSLLKCDQCDKSWGENGGFFIRRARLIFSGQINDRVYLYFQPDFASSPSSTANNFAQLRDAYMDLGLSQDNTYRLRIGQSKVPFGFENMQSSQNRLPLDRNDALNSAVSNERDLGVNFYWAPKSIRKLYSSLVSEGLKGSGDYGVFGFGVYNGQTANKPEANNNLHTVMRLSYPFTMGNQIIEAGIQGYTGQYVLGSDQISSGVKLRKDRSYQDARAAASFILYPKPFGIQAEYNIGKGPEFNKLTDSIETKSLKGGYITTSYKTTVNNQVFIPFTRFQYYKGGKKHELDARSYEVTELELGLEWQPNKSFELVTMYTLSSRRFEDYKNQDNLQRGGLLRIQAQINF
jgi:phosphate-selective porin